MQDKGSTIKNKKQANSSLAIRVKSLFQKIDSFQRTRTNHFFSFPKTIRQTIKQKIHMSRTSNKISKVLPIHPLICRNLSIVHLETSLRRFVHKKGTRRTKQSLFAWYSFGCQHFKSSDCLKKLQKGCAYCMLQSHAKHLEEMLEIDSFNKVFKNNFIKANSLYTQSLIILKDLNNHPLEQFFIQMKSAILSKLEEMEDKIKSIYRAQISEALALNLLAIKKFNQQFSGYNNKRFEELIKDPKQQDRLNSLVNGEYFENYQTSLEEINAKLDTNQISIEENEIVQITQNLEEKAVSIISKAMQQSNQNDKNVDKNMDNLVTFQCDQSQSQIKKSEEVVKSSHQSENQSPRQIITPNQNIPPLIKRSLSSHMGIPPQIIISPRIALNQNIAITGTLNSARQQICNKQSFIFLNK